MPDRSRMLHVSSQKLRVMNIHFAPVQGHTDAPYRHFHAFCYEGINTYYTPFIRLERNELRNRDRGRYPTPRNLLAIHLPPDKHYLLHAVAILLVPVAYQPGFRSHHSA